MPSHALSQVFFTATQQKILGLLFGKPEQSFYTNEIARWAQVGKGSLLRELERMQGAGILLMNRQGNQTHYQVNPQCPIYHELLSIVRKTLGLAEPLRDALLPFAEQLAWAFVYGSVARGQAHASSDIDLMLIGRGLHYSDLMERLLPLEEQLGRPINPTLYTPEEWSAKHGAGNSFVQRVRQQEKFTLMGSDPLESTDGRTTEAGEPVT
ncbi:nucleotidyltransferase domain-containing protein [Pseudomonas sp. NFXW11]|uniref:nucleotidyltransferase domain-containing protein n=1 Tax=Pseudomonas sp. NFXW11 TaxID=2819531 RepID=UPI003CF3AE7A